MGEKLIILDNARVHTAEFVTESFNKNFNILFNVHYSPFYKPCEMVFGFLKRRLFQRFHLTNGSRNPQTTRDFRVNFQGHNNEVLLARSVVFRRWILTLGH